MAAGLLLLLLIPNSPETNIFHFVLAADNAPDRTHRRYSLILCCGDVRQKPRSQKTNQIEDIGAAAAGGCCCCWLLLLLAAAAAGGCCCWWLLLLVAAAAAVAAAGGCCWLLLLVAAAAGGCCCWWLLLLVAAAAAGCWPSGLLAAGLLLLLLIPNSLKLTFSILSWLQITPRTGHIEDIL